MLIIENKTQIFSLDQYWGMRCSKLKEILRENNKSASGTKQILEARCYALNPVVDDREITADGLRPQLICLYILCKNNDI